MRFRFRTLLIFFTLVACCCGALGHVANRYRAICAADKLGALISYDGQAKSYEKPQWKDAFRRVEMISSERSVDDERLRYVLGYLWDVKKLKMTWGRPNVETAALIGRLPLLE